MAINFRASSSGTISNTTIINVTKPTGTLTGDTVIVAIASSVDRVVTPAPGFVLIPGGEVSGTNFIRLYRKIALSDDGATYSFAYDTAGSGTWGALSIYADSGNPLIVDAISTQTNATSTNREWASVTTTVANTFLAAFATLSSGQSSTPDAAMTERYDQGTTSRNYLMTQIQAAIGATGTRTATGTAAGSKTVLVAFKEGTPLANGVLVTQTGLYVERTPITQLEVSQTGLYVDYAPVTEVQITQAGLYIETKTISEVHVTQAGLYIETSTDPAFAGISAPGISATPVSSHSIDIDLVINATVYDGHIIDRSLNGTSGWVQIADLGVGVDTFTDTGLDEVTQYYYRARAYDAVNEGVNSYNATATTMFPIRLRNFTTPVSNGGLASFNVNTPAGVVENDLMILAIYNEVASHPLPTVPAGWTLIYTKPTAVLADDVRVYYKRATAAEPANHTISGVPTGSVTYAGITAWFSDNSELVVIDDFDYATYTTSTTKSIPETMPTVEHTVIHAITALPSAINSTPGTGWTEYWDIGTAVRTWSASKEHNTITPTETTAGTNASTTAHISSVVLLRRTEALNPTMPTNVIATATNFDTATITWTEQNADNDGYKIERSPNGTSGWVEIGDVLQGVGTFDDTDLIPATSNYYRVIGYIGSTLSNPSIVTSVIPPYPIRLRNSNAQSFSAATTATVNKPVGTLEGDLMLLSVNLGATGLTPVLPDGWTLASGNPTFLSANDIQVWYKQALADEDASYLITWGGTARNVLAGIASYYHGYGEPLIIEGSDYGSFASSTTRSAPAVTTISDYTLLLNFVGAAVGAVHTPAAGKTEVWDINLGSNALYHVYDEIEVAGTLTGTTVATSTNGAAHRSFSAVLGIDPSLAERPIGVSATAVSDSQINLTWTEASLENDGYIIERSPDGIGSWVEIADLPSPVTSYSDTGLDVAEDYYYRIAAYVGGDFSTYTDVLSATTLHSLNVRGTSTLINASSDTTVNAPAGLEAGDFMLMEVSSNQAAGLPNPPSDWTLVESIVTATKTLRVFAKVATASEPVSYAMTRTATETYSVGIVAWYHLSDDAIGVDASSQRVSAVNSSTRTYPSVTTTKGYYALNHFLASALNTDTTPTDVSHTEIWDASSSNARIQAMYKRYNTTPGATPEVTGTGSSTTTQTVTVALVAYEEPAPPTLLTSSSNAATNADLSWVNISQLADGYTIERSLDGLTGWTEVGDVPYTSNGFTDTGLTASTQYYYRVRAYMGEEVGEYSKITNVTTTESGHARVTELITLAGAELTSIISPQFLVYAEILNAQLRATKVGVLPEIKSEEFHVTKFGVLIELFYEEVQEGGMIIIGDYKTWHDHYPKNVTAISPFEAYNFITSSNGMYMINLEWDDVENEDGYEIERSFNGVSGWELIQVTDPNVTQYISIGLNPGATYYYRIRSFNEGGYSDYSDVVSETTQAIGPSLLGKTQVVNLVNNPIIIPKPLGVLGGDFMIMQIGVQDDDMILFPDGWTLETTLTGDYKNYILTKVANASEPDTYSIERVDDNDAVVTVSIFAWDGRNDNIIFYDG